MMEAITAITNVGQYKGATYMKQGN
jgi:hypothetical protein